MTIAEGTQFGPYRLLEKIGAGGMGEVYRVLDTRLEREAALKLVSDSYLVADAGSASPSPLQPHDTPAHATPHSGSHACHERFQREARSAAPLNHPNVCAIYDTGEQDGRPYLVMELLRGETLKRYLAKAGGNGLAVRRRVASARRYWLAYCWARDLERRGCRFADAAGGQEEIRRPLRSKGEVLRRSIFVPLVVLTLLLAGCKSTYYKTMRTLGKEKRDILVQRIKDAKKDQDQTKKQLQTTMESFQALTGFQGGSLEKSYKRLNSDYESAASQAGKLHDKIQSIDQVSNDLFKEWQGEISAMENGKLKSQDTVMLRNAKTRQATYMRAMRRTEDQIAPVLKAFHDQVLFLKHNLNSRAIGSLKNTSAGLQGDVSDLIQSIDASSQEADKLISSLAASDSNN
jgi:hypothetical protein